jgi:hypothetical protein
MLVGLVRVHIKPCTICTHDSKIVDEETLGVETYIPLHGAYREGMHFGHQFVESPILEKKQGII